MRKIKLMRRNEAKVEFMKNALSLLEVTRVILHHDTQFNNCLKECSE